MLIFPNKRRLYFCSSKEQKVLWMNTIKYVSGYRDISDFYVLGKNIGSGKYGIVKMAFNKENGIEVAVKIVSKKELSIQDRGLISRETEALKIC